MMETLKLEVMAGFFNSCLSENASGTVIAGNVFSDEAISCCFMKGDCEPEKQASARLVLSFCRRKHLAMTDSGVFRQTLINQNQSQYLILAVVLKIPK
jgi:hypothetical protein